MVFKFLGNSLNPCIFTHFPSPMKTLHQIFITTLSQSRNKILFSPRQCFFKNLFPKQQKGVQETIICFIKIQSENMKMAQGIKLFISASQLEEQSRKQSKVIFQMRCFYNFVSNISTIQYCINFIVSLCNRNNFILNLYQIKYYFDEGRLFIGRFKIESVPEMINKKKCLPNLFTNLHMGMKSYLPRKISKFVTLSILKKEVG